LESQNISSATNAGSALSVVDRAIAQIDTYRAKLGAYSNRMEHAASNLLSRVEHQSAARSRIQDADYAVESANLAKAQVLQQAGTAMLAQANASSQNILSLLK
jgi:flagellin